MERIIPTPYYIPHVNPHITHTALHHIHPQQYYHNNTPPATILLHSYGGPSINAPLLQPYQSHIMVTPIVYGPPMAYVSVPYQESQLLPSHHNYYLEGPPALHNNNDSRSNHDNLFNHYLGLLDIIGRLSENEAGQDLGLSEETISRDLKTRRYAGEKDLSEKDRGERDVCSVCLDEFEKNQRIGTLECGHEYHAECIHKWLLEKNTCPICRAPALR